MAFDRSDPADLLALKTEVNTDPIAMGYDPTGNTQTLLKLLNDPDNNVGGETTARTFDVEAMLDALDPPDFDANPAQTGRAEYTHILVETAAVTGDISAYKTKWRSMYPANSPTVTALDAQTSPLSRGEVLFGQFTVITRDDWAAARSS